MSVLQVDFFPPGATAGLPASAGPEGKEARADKQPVPPYVTAAGRARGDQGSPAAAGVNTGRANRVPKEAKADRGSPQP